MLKSATQVKISRITEVGNMNKKISVPGDLINRKITADKARRK